MCGYMEKPISLINKEGRSMSNVIKYSRPKTVYGTGLVALDIVISSNPEEPTYQWAGGTCGNVLTILSYLDWKSYPIARLNSDASSLHAKNDMKQWKVNLDYAEMTPTASIPVITQEITKDKNGQPKHKFHWKNCPKCGSWLPNYKPVTLKSTALVKEAVNASDVYFFDRTSSGALDLARHFKELGALIFFEPSAKGDPKHFAEAIKLADIVKYSDQRFASVITESTEKHRPHLEIQTLGDNGLRYRTKRRKRWTTLPAFDMEDILDTCGCGDWTTAGVIHHLCQSSEGFANQTPDGFEAALRYGQALGAWNCSFEGARSGMYRMTKRAFTNEVEAILENGKPKKRKSTKSPNVSYASDGLCPACPAS